MYFISMRKECELKLNSNEFGVYVIGSILLIVVFVIKD